jgi:hypothetical protein
MVEQPTPMAWAPLASRRPLDAGGTTGRAILPLF